MHRNLIALQRAVAVQAAGAEVLQLQHEGYAVDADRALDILIERMDEWRRDGQG